VLSLSGTSQRAVFAAQMSSQTRFGVPGLDSHRQNAWQ
jgi:hypothetical protein